MRFRINVQSIIRAGLHAGFAADTTVFVKIYDTIFPNEERLHRTNFYAGCIGAVVASHHGEESPGIGKFSFFYLLHPGAVDAYGNIVFRFAGCGAGVAAYALSVVYYESVFHAVLISDLRFRISDLPASAAGGFRKYDFGSLIRVFVCFAGYNICLPIARAGEANISHILYLARLAGYNIRAFPLFTPPSSFLLPQLPSAYPPYSLLHSSNHSLIH
jgi:hypothetical protein